MKIVNEPGFMAGNEIVDLRNVGYQYNPQMAQITLKTKKIFNYELKKGTLV